MLTRADYIYFANAIVADESRKANANETRDEKLVNDAMDAAEKITIFKYRYNELQTDDTDRNRASKAATFNVLKRLDDLKFQSILSGEKLTPEKINEVLQAAFKENDQIYADGVKIEFEDYIAEIQDDRGITIDPADPFGSLDAWFKESDQGQLDTGVNYRRIKRRLNEFKRQGVFQ